MMNRDDRLGVGFTREREASREVNEVDRVERAGAAGDRAGRPSRWGTGSSRPFGAWARDTATRRRGEASLLTILLSGGVCLSVISVTLAFGGTADPEPSATSPAKPAAPPAEIVDQYCLACHGGASPAAGLALDSIDWSNPAANAGALEKVVKRLRAGTMPPAGMPRPQPAEYDSISTWIEAELDRSWAAKPNPGRVVPVHRLNRTEYNNAVNDLLGLNVDVTALLPGDPTADGGFDNMAEALPFTTAHLERYMSVARQVSRLAVGIVPDNAGVTTYEVPLHIVQDWRQSEDLPFGSRGGLSVEHHFPANGEYRFVVRLRANWQDYIMGLGWPQQLEIRLDGRLLDRFTIGGEAPGLPAPMSFSGPGAPGSLDWEEYMFTADERIEVTVPVTAGPHVVGVSYVREHLQPEDVPQPQQRGRLLANDEVYMDYQQVGLLEVWGPYGDVQVGVETPSRTAIFSCYPDTEAEEGQCATEILSRLGRRALRRPLVEADIERLLDFFERGRERGGSFDAGVQFALEYLLSDPEFLVRTYPAPDGVASGETYRLRDLEIASRLSFFLWGTIPDDHLLELAERGELSNPATLREQAARMLADPRAVRNLTTNFAAQWLNLRRIDDVVVDPEIYPTYDESLLEGFREETELFVANGIREDASVLELLKADYTYLNERLARHYGVPGVYGSRFRKVTLPDPEQRGGILGQGAILAVTSYPGRTSPVLRGKWILDNILGTPPPPPPPNVPVLPEGSEGAALGSVRDRLAAHRENPACSGCHSMIDPLGFALENFDVIGGWRTADEAGHPVDARASWPAGEEFEGFTGLRDWLLARPASFAETVTEKLMTYALGRRLDFYDRPAVRRIVQDAAEHGYSWSSLVLGIVESPAFTMSTAQ